MPRFVWFIGILVVAFCGWWGFAMVSMKSGIGAWLEERRAEGWQAEVSALEHGGFPKRLRTDLRDLALADPETGLALRMDTLSLAARTVWPGDVQVQLPPTPVLVASPFGRARITAEAGLANLNIAPGADLALENLSFTSGPIAVESPEGPLFSLNRSELRMTHVAGSAPETYAVTLFAGQFTPGAVPRNALLVPEDWPVVFTALQGDAVVTFDRPWDRAALDTVRPQPRRIDLANLEAHWGDVRLRLAGGLDVDTRGTPRGEVTLRAENWQALLDLAQNAGALPDDLRRTVENVLRSLAAGSGRTQDLDITLTFDNGLIRVGFLPIGPAPKLILR